MKYDLISDFHLEMNVLNRDTSAYAEGDPVSYAWHKDRKSQILVVAGDISNETSLSCTILMEAAMYYDAVLFVDGNHEHYDCTYFVPSMYGGGDWKVDSTVPENMQQMRDFADQHDNIGYLDGKRHFVRDGCLFIGANGWYDFQVPEEINYKKRLYAWRTESNDPNRITWGKTPGNPNATIAEAKKQAADLRKKVTWAQDQDDIHEIVVVTHTVPVAGGLIDRANLKFFNYYKANGAYYNSEMNRVLAADTKGKIKAWNFGHTHFPHDFVERGVRFICNPRGYRSERRKVGGFGGIIQVDTDSSKSAFGEIE